MNVGSEPPSTLKKTQEVICIGFVSLFGMIYHMRIFEIGSGICDAAEGPLPVISTKKTPFIECIIP